MNGTNTAIMNGTKATSTDYSTKPPSMNGTTTSSMNGTNESSAAAAMTDGTKHADEPNPTPASGKEKEELEKEFHAQQHCDFYCKDIGQDKEEADAIVDKEEIIRNAKSLGLPVIGGGLTASADLLSTLWDKNKRRAWYGTVKRLQHFFLSRGIWPSLIEGLFAPNVLSNMSIMGKIQEELEISDATNRRRTAALHGSPITFLEKKQLMEHAARYVRYATAAYGVAMIQGAEAATMFEPEEPSREGIMGLVGGVFGFVGSLIDKAQDIIFAEERRKDKIRRYVGLQKPDPSRGISDGLVELDNIGANENIVGYFVAIENRKSDVAGLNKSIVLAIRGTYSVSGLLADAEGFSVEFCGGYAHKAISDRAVNLWQKVKQTIVKQLKDHPHHDLVLTGHSLGAGVAVLLNIMLHFDGALESLAKEVGRDPKDLKIRCVAIASPPVYCMRTTIPEQKQSINSAIDNCVAFIHRNDVVPFLDGNAVYRLASTLGRVDRKTRSMNPLVVNLYAFCDRVRDFSNLQEIKDIVAEFASDLPDVEGLQDLLIPARNIFWFAESSDYPRQYDAALCDPVQLTKLPVFVSGPDMIINHLTPDYERAIYSVLRQMKGNHGHDPTWPSN
ncbi:hypothetical protein ACA910_019037 [Epithemia clementina (nom. ined.)]